MSAKARPQQPDTLGTILRNLNDQDAQVAIDEPWHVVRRMCEDAVKLFHQLTGRPPRRVYLTKVVEVALEVDFARVNDLHGSLRKSRAKLFGCDVVWDADAFRLE